MSNQQPQPRTFAEKARPWLAVIWLLVGALWFASALREPTVFHWILAAFWLLGGGFYTTVAVLERRNSPRRRAAAAADGATTQEKPQ